MGWPLTIVGGLGRGGPAAARGPPLGLVVVLAVDLCVYFLFTTMRRKFGEMICRQHVFIKERTALAEGGWDRLGPDEMKKQQRRGPATAPPF